MRSFAQVDLCRATPGGAKNCIEVFQDVTKVFALMQKQVSDFAEVGRRPSPKGVLRRDGSSCAGWTPTWA